MASADILHALGNKYNAEILGTADEPLSAQELSDVLDVPIATCYRRINELTETGLLEHHDSVLSDEHRRVDVYRRNVSEIRVRFDEDRYDVDLEERTTVKNKLDDVWRTLSES